MSVVITSTPSASGPSSSEAYPLVGVDGMKVTRQLTVSSPTVRVDREREDAEFRWLLGERSGFDTMFVLTENYGLYSNRYEHLVSVMCIASENG